MSALRLVSGAAGRSAVGVGAATRWRRLTALLPARQLSTAAGAAAAKAAPKAAKAMQHPPLQTAADVQRFLTERAALKAKRMANPPRARPDVERERLAALQSQGLVTVPVRWRPRAEAAADTRQQLQVPATLATRDRDGRRTYLSIAVPRRQLMQEMAKNVVHCRVYRMEVTGVPGHEGKTLTYNAVCTRINQPPMTDGPQNAEFVLFEPYAPTRVVVPVQFEGVEDCIGRKHGGLVFFRTDRVSAWWCGDHNIPSKFVVDVLHADVGTTFHLSDLHWPKGLRPAERYNHLLCSVRGSTLKDIDEEQKQADEAAAAAGGAVGAAAGGAAAPAAGGAAPKADAKAGGDDKKADKK